MSNPKEAVIRSSFFPPDVLDGTKLFIVEVDSEIPIFAVKTRWEIFGYTRDIKGAIAAFEELLLVKDASEIDQVLTFQRAKGNLKRRKASRKTLTATHIHEGETVKIKPEFCDHPDEAKDEYVVVEDKGDRLDISPKKWGHGKIIPRETVERKMLMKASRIKVAKELVRLAKELLAEQWEQVPGEFVGHPGLSGAKIKIVGDSVKALTEKGGNPHIGRPFSTQDSGWLDGLVKLLGLSEAKRSGFETWLHDKFPRVKTANRK
jgi:hypothetical protein